MVVSSSSSESPEFIPQEIIAKKRDGAMLSLEEIEFFIKGITTKTISDAQIAAFTMAVHFQGMQIEELVPFTKCIALSGHRSNWQQLHLPGPVLDKHSTGGVGDKASLILVPLLAACGAYVPKCSGSALGHSGGTLDKLRSIPGLKVLFKPNETEKILKHVGCFIVGQSADVVPADKRIYAVRDQTATVGVLALLASSILSKKILTGTQGLVLDVKQGSGALMADEHKMKLLAQIMLQITTAVELPACAVLTDMNQCLGQNVGNAVELIEVIDFLKGQYRDPRLQQVVFMLGQKLLLLGKLVETEAQAQQLLQQNLENGNAAEKFAAMISAQGGPTYLLEHTQKYMPQAAVQFPVIAEKEGYINKIDVSALGMSLYHLGGMRNHTGHIDYSVGLSAVRGVGDVVNATQPLAIVHARTQEEARIVASLLNKIFQIGEQKPIIAPVVRECLFPS